MSPGADAMLDRNRSILTFDNPRRSDVKNLQNWVENTSSIAQDETAYLSEPRDLLTTLSPQDDALSRLAPLLEGFMRTLYRVFSKVSGLHATRQKLLGCDSLLRFSVYYAASMPSFA